MRQFGVSHRRARWSRSSLVVRGVMTAGLFSAGAVRYAADGGLSVAWLVPLALLALGWAVWPHSAAGLVGMVGVLALWGMADPGVLHSAWLLVAVLSLAAAHIAGLLAGLAPPTSSLDAGLLGLWVRRWVVLAAFGATAWAGASAVGGAGPSHAAWAAAGAVLTLVVLVVVPLLSRGREVAVGVDDMLRNPYRGGAGG